jgi:hypothetical protein
MNYSHRCNRNDWRIFMLNSSFLSHLIGSFEVVDPIWMFLTLSCLNLLLLKESWLFADDNCDFVTLRTFI